MDNDLLKSITLEFPANDTTEKLIINLDLNEYSQKSMWIYFNQGKLYEPETSRLFCTLLKTGDSVLDIGGHVGYFSLLAAAITGPTGQVVTFEPEADNYQHLIENIKQNQFSNIQVIHKAVGDKEGEVTFYINADNDGGHALWDISKHEFNEKSREHMEERKIPQTTLDIALKGFELEPLRLIKMDVEGCEYKVLQGAQETLKKYNYPIIILEINRFAMEHMDCSEQDIRSLMKSMGYLTYYPEETHLVELKDEEYANPGFVFNLVFAQPGSLP